MQKRSLYLFSLHLPETLEIDAMSARLGTPLTKGIESTYYTRMDETFIAYTRFNVLTLISEERTALAAIYAKLGFRSPEHYPMAVYQDYPIEVDPGMETTFSVDNERIVLREASLLNLVTVSLVVSQSVALEVFEQKLLTYFRQSRDLIEAVDTYSIFKRGRLARFARNLTLIRHDMLVDLHLLDKPNVLWDNEEAEMLYNRLASILELKDRFDVVEYKLSNLKDDIMMVLELTNHKHSSFLEWIIIILILIEIIMGLIEWFAPGLGH